MKNSKTQQDDPEQSKRFIDAIKEIGVDEPSNKFDNLFDKVVRLKPKPIQIADAKKSQ